jgi:nitrate reductase molybdenum cofactor assembly chaperone NarJ/NarW
MKTLKALSVLVTYPTAELCTAVPEIRATFDEERVLPERERAALEPLLQELAASDLYDLQERYVLLFDRSRSLSLHLFEHVHGESRDRGQAMVDLQALYAKGGFGIACTELPDFVPLFVEYCSQRPDAEARALLAEPAHVLIALGERLRAKQSSYAAVFDALAALASTKPDVEAFQALIDIPEIDPQDLHALDAVWEEEEVRFGAGDAQTDCGINSLGAKLRQARRPAPGLAVPTTRGARTIITHSSARA